jgi:hypothetical protein
MIDQKNNFLKRVFNVLKTEGFKGVTSRFQDRFLSISKWSQVHTFVFSFQSGSVPDSSSIPTGLDPLVVRAQERAQRFLSNLEIKQLTLSDIEEIDELTGIDPWGITKSFTLKKLQDGWHCYVAKYQGRIVANGWIIIGPEVHDEFFRRSFTLADNEVLGWRGFCVPDFRGRGVSPWLNKCVVNNLALTTGINKSLAWVRVTNVAQLRTVLETGWSMVGRLGFIEIFGFRLHYLWGRRAFSATRKRCFIQRQKRR